MPTPYKAVPTGYCAECGNRFPMTQPNRIFCDGECRQAQWNRRVTGGFKLYEAAMRWRIDRQKGDMAELTSIADLLANEERFLRKRREDNIKRQAGRLPDGVAVAPAAGERAAGQSLPENVKLSPKQQRALARAGKFTIDLSEGKRPNDPADWPDQWPGIEIDAIRAALELLPAAA